MAAKSRAVHGKLEALLDLMTGGLCEEWEVSTAKALIAKLQKATHALTRSRVRPSD